MLTKKIGLLPGDGIGPEVTAEAVKVLHAVSKISGVNFEFTEASIGAAAIYKHGNPLPDSTLDVCNNCDAILFGAIGSPEFDNNPSASVRPEQGLLKLRKELSLFANIRPVKVYNSIAHLSPFKEERIKNVNFVVVRELTGGIYFGKKETSADGKTATDICSYSVNEIERIAHVAFNIAMHRKKKLTLVDKANVLETSRLWRKVVSEIANKYNDVELEMMYVDNAAMKLIQAPASFDVILTENMFGDILTDEASVISGSIGLMPSASIGKNCALYEPIHGSYPQAAGKQIANPIGAILSAAMMLEQSFGMAVEAAIIEKAVNHSINSGICTPDISTTSNHTTADVGNAIASLIKEEIIQAV